MMTPRVFEPGDPDAATDVPAIVMLANGPALHASDLRLTVGTRRDGGEDLILSLSTGGGTTLFSPFTSITARVLGEGLIAWADEREAAASETAAAALSKAGGGK